MCCIGGVKQQALCQRLGKIREALADGLEAGSDLGESAHSVIIGQIWHFGGGVVQIGKFVAEGNGQEANLYGWAHKATSGLGRSFVKPDSV